MSDDLHRKARHLIADAQIEGISSEERVWLNRHLEECPNCEQSVKATDQALDALRALSIPLPPDLASRTQMRVYLRAREMRSRRQAGWMVWTACGISWAAGIASAPYVWRGFEWLGHQAGLPSLLWKTGFVLWWTVPAVVAMAAALLDRSYVDWFRTRE
jgi:anti-sigma factor RsiW